MSGFDERDRLARALHDRSQDVGGHPLDLDTVKRSARRIQRRRRAAVGLAAAAVLAVAVPAGFAMTGTSTRSVGPAARPSASVTTSASASPSASPSQSPSSDSSPSATASPDNTGRTTGISLGVLGTGPAPTIGWLEGRTYHHDGTTSLLPALPGSGGTYTDVSAYHGGWLATAHTDQGARVLTIDNTGKVVSDQAGGDRIVATGDGTQIAWVADGSIHQALPSGMSDAEASQKIPDGVFADVVGWAFNQVVYATSGGDNASVYRTGMGGTNRVVPGLITSRGSSDVAGLIGGMISYDNKTGTSCWAVVKPTGERIWRTCDWALETFSPDGSLVLGTPADGDGLGSKQVALLDAHSGEVRAIFDLPPNGFASGFGWEDDGHVLASMYDDGQWGVVRLAPDGSARRVLPTVKGTDTDPPYYLVGR